jgi:hypothetical protein
MCTVDVNGDTTFEDLKEPQVVVQMVLKEVPETRSNGQDDNNESFGGSYLPDIEGTIHEQYRKAGRPLTTTHLVQQERRQRALTLRTAGATFEAIAHVLGWSGPSGAHYAVKKARQELNAAAPIENAEELRSVIYARLNELLSRVWPSAMGGTIDGRYIPPNIKSVREARLIVAQITDLMGVKALPEERSVQASWQNGGFERGDQGPIIYCEFDEERRIEQMRIGTLEALPVPMDIPRMPPSGRIAPSPTDRGPDSKGGLPPPNSVDEETGEPIFDPRIALKADPDEHQR